MYSEDSLMLDSVIFILGGRRKGENKYELCKSIEFLFLGIDS